MLNSARTLVSPTPTTLERYLLEFESSMSVSFVSEYSRKSIVKAWIEENISDSNCLSEGRLVICKA